MPMKKQVLRCTLYVVIVYLASFTLNLTIAASQPAVGDAPHFCGVVDCQPGKRYWDQFANRRYAQAPAAAALNVGEPRTVRLIYFLPNDRPYREDVVQRMKEMIRGVQTFYAEQMGAHGHGEVTFRIETDPQGNPMVHRVDGQYPDSHYISNDLFLEAPAEVGQVFNLDPNIYLIVVDSRTEALGPSCAYGIGWREGKNAGWAMVTETFSWEIAAHELGHAFGLWHNFLADAYIMSYGEIQQRSLSAYSADFLAVHPWFNPAISIEAGQPPAIELISPRTYPAGSESVSIQLRVSDSEGLHQVILRSNNNFAVEAHRELAGEKDALVEFDYDVTHLHLIYVEAVDTEGNVNEVSFALAEMLPYHTATLEGDTGSVNSVLFSPDGRTLASGAGVVVELWDVGTRQNIATLKHLNTVTSVSFSPDGTLLASGVYNGMVELWDIATRQNIFTLEEHTEGVTSVSFSPDGRTLASGSYDKTVKLWDVGIRQNIATLRHSDAVHSVSFSPDGTTLASGADDKTVKLWDVGTRQNIFTLEGHTEGVTSVSFSPDGRILASGTWYWMVKLWDVATGTNIATLKGDTISFSSASCVSLSPDGRILASAAQDYTVRLWDVATGAIINTLGYASRVYSVSFSSDGTDFATGLESGMVELWDSSSWTRLRLEAVTEIDIPDPNLRAAIVTALGKPLSAPIRRGHMRALSSLKAQHANISDLTGLEFATNLRDLFLDDNSISDISAVAGLTNLRTLSLSSNPISDLSPLVANMGLGRNDYVFVQTLLSYPSIYTHVPILQERGVRVYFDDRVPTSLVKVSGDQHGTPSAPLSNPFIVEVRDAHGGAFLGIPVTFAVTAGGGILSVTRTTTDLNGRAESRLTLGPNLGTTTVSVFAAEIEDPVTFTVVGMEGVIISDSNLRAAIVTALEVVPDIRITPSEMATLTSLDADNADINDLTGLEFATNLTFLSLDSNNITDLSPLSGLTHLTSLSLYSNLISDISPLSGLTHLTFLHLGTNSISDLSPLVANTGLGRGDTVYLWGNPLSYPSIHTHIPVLQSRGVAVEFNTIDSAPADVNGDGVVNILDLVLIAASFGQSGQHDADVNGDGVVSILDLVLAAGMFDAPVAAPATQPHAPAPLTAVEIQGWLTKAWALQVRDPIMKGGIIVLEQLLASMIPAETELLANYPNPFNPETWIPYQLAEDSFVTLTIYDLAGQVVRTIDVGHQTAAVYENRAKAIHWDGRNELGEQVASGIYFYQLSAGDYSATRKMVILK